METLRVAARQHHRQTTDGHAESVRALSGVPDPEQPAVRIHVQPGRGHLSGDVPAEDIHHGRVLRTDTEAQAAQAPVDRAGGANLGRRPRPAQRLEGQGVGPPAEPSGRSHVGADRVLPVRVRRRLLREDTEGSRRVDMDAKHPAELRVAAAGTRRVLRVRLEPDYAERLFLRLRPVHRVPDMSSGGRRAHRGHGCQVRRQHTERVCHLSGDHRRLRFFYVFLRFHYKRSVCTGRPIGDVLDIFIQLY